MGNENKWWKGTWRDEAHRRHAREVAVDVESEDIPPSESQSSSAPEQGGSKTGERIKRLGKNIMRSTSTHAEAARDGINRLREMQDKERTHRIEIEGNNILNAQPWRREQLRTAGWSDDRVAEYARALGALSLANSPFRRGAWTLRISERTVLAEANKILEPYIKRKVEENKENKRSKTKRPERADIEAGSRLLTIAEVLALNRSVSTNVITEAQMHLYLSFRARGGPGRVATESERKLWSMLNGLLEEARNEEQKRLKELAGRKS